MVARPKLADEQPLPNYHNDAIYVPVPYVTPQGEQYQPLCLEPLDVTTAHDPAAPPRGLDPLRVQHALLWHRIFYYELQGAASRSGFRSFALSAAPPTLATYLNVFCSAPLAGLVKPLVDGPGPYKHLCAGANPR